MQDKEEKINFFKRVIISIKDFEKYQFFAAETVGKAIKYLALLMVIFTVVISAIFTYKFSVSINNAINYFEENISEVSYKENYLSVNSGEEIILKNEKEVMPIVIINTNATQENIEKYKDELNRYENGIIILNDRIIYKNVMLSQNMEYTYENIANNYNISEFNKQDITNLIQTVNQINLYISFFIVVFIYMFIIYFTSTLIDVVIIGVLGFIFARIVSVKLRYKATFNMGAYALTLPIILNLIYIVVNAFTGFTIEYFQWMYTTISYIYMIVAILMIKADLINRQAELMKIVEEQEKVKQEIEEQERKKEEEKKKEPKDTKEPEEKKEEKKEDKKQKDGNVGDEGLAPQ